MTRWDLNCVSVNNCCSDLIHLDLITMAIKLDDIKMDLHFIPSDGKLVSSIYNNNDNLFDGWKHLPEQTTGTKATLFKIRIKICWGGYHKWCTTIYIDLSQQCKKQRQLFGNNLILFWLNVFWQHLQQSIAVHSFSANVTFARRKCEIRAILVCHSVSYLQLTRRCDWVRCQSAPIWMRPATDIVS